MLLGKKDRQQAPAPLATEPLAPGFGALLRRMSGAAADPPPVPFVLRIASSTF